MALGINDFVLIFENGDFVNLPNEFLQESYIGDITTNYYINNNHELVPIKKAVFVDIVLSNETNMEFDTITSGLEKNLWDRLSNHKDLAAITINMASPANRAERIVLSSEDGINNDQSVEIQSKGGKIFLHINVDHTKKPKRQ